MYLILQNAKRFKRKAAKHFASSQIPNFDLYTKNKEISFCKKKKFCALEKEKISRRFFVQIFYIYSTADGLWIAIGKVMNDFFFYFQ